MKVVSVTYPKQKSFAEIVAEWDALAPIRLNHITDGTDVTYRRFIIPQMASLLGNVKHRNVLDAGCGVGFFANHISSRNCTVIAIDPSSTSIKVAREAFSKSIEFQVSSLEDFAENNSANFDAIVANMVLMDVLDLDSFLSAAKKVLAPGGTMIFSVTHPWFWPEYSGYANLDWFNYHQEIVIEAPFSITRAIESSFPSTHIHRPLNSYFAAFARAEMNVVTMMEPMPSSEVQSLYPVDWQYPRYLFGVLRKRVHQ